MEVKEFICTVCPRGCNIRVKGSGEEIIEITGNKCNRGSVFARAEFINPERLLTTTVRVKNHRSSVLPVRTEKPIPKDRMMDAMDILKDITVEGPINMGDLVLKDILGTGVDVIVAGY